MAKHSDAPYDGEMLLKRIFAQRIIDPITGCWLWPHRSTGGYGQIRFVLRYKAYAVSLHRLIAWLYLGHDGRREVFVCHRCNVKACFNPAHLYLASCLQNNRDAYKDGLRLRCLGEKHHYAKLTNAQVVEIIQRKGTATPRELAKEYGVTAKLVKRILDGETWKHLQPETIQ